MAEAAAGITPEERKVARYIATHWKTLVPALAVVIGWAIQYQVGNAQNDIEHGFMKAQLQVNAADNKKMKDDLLSVRVQTEQELGDVKADVREVKADIREVRDTVRWIRNRLR
jgi:hypothetical protein